MIQFRRRKKVKKPKPKDKKRVNKRKKKKGQGIRYPARLVAPVKNFLQSKLRLLERRKKGIEKEDPFSDTSRIIDNASPDTDAAEQFGHARTTAIKEQIDRKIIQTKKALAQIKVGKYGVCEECGRMIDTDRLMAYPEATLCATDAAKKEK